MGILLAVALQTVLLDRAASRLGLPELTKHGFVQLTFDRIEAAIATIHI